jgi:hypothetical protein
LHGQQFTTCGVGIEELAGSAHCRRPCSHVLQNSFLFAGDDEKVYTLEKLSLHAGNIPARILQ